MHYDNILKAHHVVHEALIFWGSSGFGKSSLVRDFASRNGFRVLEKRTCYVDPMAVVLPHKDMERGLVTFMPADWLHTLMHSTEPTILFLDEFNRPASPQTFSLFTELLLDRSVDGLRISDSVLIVGACNLSEEDTGVVDVPVAVMNRATHLVHAPSIEEVCANLSTELARKVVPSVAKQLLRTPGIPELTLEACPRQIDSCCRLYSTGLLSSSEFAMICRGRLGTEKGIIFAEAMRLHQEKARLIMPTKLTTKSMPALKDLEKQGLVLEVVSFLTSYVKESPDLVAAYLIDYAGPETCRSLVQQGFICDVERNGETMDWRGFAAKAGKLSPKRAA